MSILAMGHGESIESRTVTRSNVWKEDINESCVDRREKKKRGRRKHCGREGRRREGGEGGREGGEEAGTLIQPCC